MSTFSVNRVNQTVKILDNFYNDTITVDASRWEVVYSFFAGNSPNRETAETFSSLLFRIAREGEIDVMDLLASLKGSNGRLEMNQIICFYLNSFRTKTALYGVGTIPAPNETAQRNVVL